MLFLIYISVYFYGLSENWKQAKKLTAKNEREATEADLKASKMQVEAADAAEETKKRLEKSM